MVDELLAQLMAAQEPAAAALSWLLERVAREPGLADAFGAGPAASTGVVDETLRLRPAAIAALRRLSAPATVAGHDLPAGLTVMVPIVLLQRESGLFLPFGGGGRRCLGEALFRTYVDASARRCSGPTSTRSCPSCCARCACARRGRRPSGWSCAARSSCPIAAR